MKKESKPLQYKAVHVDDLIKDKLVNKRLYLKEKNHLGTMLLWEGDRIDVYYLPETNQVQTTIEIGSGLYHIELVKVEKKGALTPITDDKLFEPETAHRVLESGLHLWDDIRTREECYQVRGNRLVYTGYR